MNNNDKYEKIPLTPSIAEEVIIELFAGKDPVSRKEIIRKVTAYYTGNGGLVPKGDPVSLCQKALDGLKKSGRARNLHSGYWAENLHGGYWKILPIINDRSEEIIFSETDVSEEIIFSETEIKDENSETEVKDESVDDLVEGLLEVIKAEISNLDEAIEALQRQKSHLEDNLTQLNQMWQNLSRK